MKKFKTLGIVVMIAVIGFCFASCGKEENKLKKNAGVYKCVEADVAGNKVTAEDIGEMKIELKDDGKAIFSIEEEKQECTWDIEEKKITLHVPKGEGMPEDTDMEMTLNDKEDGFVVDDFIGTGMKLVFEKE